MCIIMFWDNFLFYCNQKGVAPNVAAQSVGIKSSGTVTGWKNGAIPRRGVLKKLAQYFEISVSDLAGDEQKEKPAPDWDGLSPAKQKLLDMIDDLSNEQCEKLFGIIEEAKKLL